MHYSAKRGLAIACRLSVCLSVCLSATLVDCDHIGWNSSKIISRLVSLGCLLLSADPNIRGLLQGEHPEIWPQSNPPPVDLSVGDIRSQIAAEWLQIEQWSQWRAYRKPPSLFRMVPSLTPYDLPFPQNGVPCAPRYRNGHICATGDPIGLHFMFGSRVGGSNGANTVRYMSWCVYKGRCKVLTRASMAKRIDTFGLCLPINAIIQHTIASYISISCYNVCSLCCWHLVSVDIVVECCFDRL